MNWSCSTLRGKGRAIRSNFERAMGEFARRCFVPLAAGGGVRGLDDVDRLLALGADKIVVNSGALQNPDLITDIARRYGSQCVVVSIDAKPNGAGHYHVHGEFGSRDSGRNAQDWAARRRIAGQGKS